MIIIITGASHTGKTCLAQRMLESFENGAYKKWKYESYSL